MCLGNPRVSPPFGDFVVLKMLSDILWSRWTFCFSSPIGVVETRCGLSPVWVTGSRKSPRGNFLLHLWARDRSLLDYIYFSIIVIGIPCSRMIWISLLFASCHFSVFWSEARAFDHTEDCLQIVQLFIQSLTVHDNVIQINQAFVTHQVL